MYKKIKLKHLSILLLVGLIIFSVLGNLRSNSASYILHVGHIIDGVDSPIFVWVYLYLSMSYENLNFYINNFNDMYFGVITFFPLFAFTLTKQFVQPNLAQYLPNPNMTVSTMMYDFYLDFGLLGTFFFPILIGAIAFYSYYLLKSSFSINTLIIYSMILHNLFFVFFINFFSNTTWIFHIGVLVLFILYTSTDKPIQQLLDKVRRKK